MTRADLGLPFVTALVLAMGLATLNSAVAGGEEFQRQLAFLAVEKPEQIFTEAYSSAGFLPQLDRLHYRHRYFLSARFVHFISYDVLDFAH